MPEKIDTELRTQGVFGEGSSTPLYQFATEGLGLRGPTTGELLQESGKITERRATRMEESATALKKKAEEAATLATEQADARKKERPAPYELPATDLTARPFLTPPQSVLGQLQTALVGIGQIAQGVGGLKGKGYAIGATAALKGALEGWQAGDQERAQRAFEQWQVDTQRLLAAHRSRRERYQDILDDQTRTMQDRLSQIGLEARISEVQDLGDAARSGEIDRVLTVLENQRAQELQLAVLMQRINKDYITHRDLQEWRAGVEKRANESLAQRERRTKVYEEFAGGQVKLEQQDASLTNKLQTADMVEEAVGIMASRNLLPTGPTTPDAFRAALQRQTAWGDPQVKWAVDVIERLGTGLVVGSEIALGEPASTMRLRAIAEPQAGHILSAGPAFWKTFFDRYRPFLKEQQTMIRSHIRSRGRLQAPAEEPEWQVVE